MRAPDTPPDSSGLTRREFVAGGTAIAATGLLAPQSLEARGAPPASHQSHEAGTPKMSIVCIIRYEIDPFKREAFRRYAVAWARIIPRLGGQLLGYFLPHEGSNYEAYRARLRRDPEAMANFDFAQRERFILREERRFTEVVPEAFQQPAMEVSA